MIIPQIIIAGVQDSSEWLEKANFSLSEVLKKVEEKFSEMDISVLVPHQNFSHQQLRAWVTEVSQPRDFFLNIQIKDTLQVQFVHQNGEEMASRLAVASAARLGMVPSPSLLSVLPVSSVSDHFTTFNLHVWNIVLPSSLSEKQLILNIMACVTDLYTQAHSLLPDDLVWPFRDVPSSHFAFEAIKKAKAKKLITGYKGDIFYPNGGITRGEIFYILDKLGLL